MPVLLAMRCQVHLVCRSCWPLVGAGAYLPPDHFRNRYRRYRSLSAGFRCAAVSAASLLLQPPPPVALTVDLPSPKLNF